MSAIATGAAADRLRLALAYNWQTATGGKTAAATRRLFLSRLPVAQVCQQLPNNQQSLVISH